VKTMTEGTKAILNGLSVAEYPCAGATGEVKRMLDRVEEHLSGGDKEKCLS
jgi:hypothetical protein